MKQTNQTSTTMCPSLTETMANRFVQTHANYFKAKGYTPIGSVLCPECVTTPDVPEIPGCPNNHQTGRE